MSLRIHEIFPRNKHLGDSYLDPDFNDDGDWIELYSDTYIDLTGLYFMDCSMNTTQVPQTLCSIDGGNTVLTWSSTGEDMSWYDAEYSDSTMFMCEHFCSTNPATTDWNGVSHCSSEGPPIVFAEINGRNAEHIKLYNRSADAVNLTNYVFSTDSGEFRICDPNENYGENLTHDGRPIQQTFGNDGDCILPSGHTLTLYQHVKPGLSYYFNNWPGVECVNWYEPTVQFIDGYIGRRAFVNPNNEYTSPLEECEQVSNNTCVCEHVINNHDLVGNNGTSHFIENYGSFHVNTSNSYLNGFYEEIEFYEDDFSEPMHVDGDDERLQLFDQSGNLITQVNFYDGGNGGTPPNQVPGVWPNLSEERSFVLKHPDCVDSISAVFYPGDASRSWGRTKKEAAFDEYAEQDCGEPFYYYPNVPYIGCPCENNQLWQTNCSTNGCCPDNWQSFELKQPHQFVHLLFEPIGTGTCLAGPDKNNTCSSHDDCTPFHVPAGGRMIVWADSNTGECGGSTYQCHDLHLDFKLSAGPEGDCANFGPVDVNLTSDALFIMESNLQVPIDYIEYRQNSITSLYGGTQQNILFDGQPGMDGDQVGKGSSIAWCGDGWNYVCGNFDENEICTYDDGFQVTYLNDNALSCGDQDTQPGLLGDVNLDGQLNIVDVVNLVSEILSPGTLTVQGLTAADYNQDGNVNIADVVLLVNQILSSGQTVMLANGGYVTPNNTNTVINLITNQLRQSVSTQHGTSNRSSERFNINPRVKKAGILITERQDDLASQYINTALTPRSKPVQTSRPGPRPKRPSNESKFRKTSKTTSSGRRRQSRGGGKIVRDNIKRKTPKNLRRGRK